MSRRRVVLLAAIALACGLAGAAAACGNGSNPPLTGDAGDDVAMIDVGVDVGIDAAPPVDAGLEVSTRCGQVMGDCNIVAQDCTGGLECVAVQGSDGGYTTGCQGTGVNQILPKGSPCCPNQGSACAPGLECLGPNCVDGGTSSSLCAPACCDDTICGFTSDGIAGRCDTQVSIGGGSALYNLCSYSTPCRPFRILPCPPDYGCIMRDYLGTATCSSIYIPPGSTEGQPCTYLNECADGLECVNGCEMVCLIKGTTPPFDAGVLDGGPGNGGCNTGKTCQAFDQTLFPPWLGLCR